MSLYEVQRVLNNELTSILRVQLPQWYRQYRRSMPWRGDATAIPITPYSIWVSEVMSQQTRVETVVNYWNRWMQRFPTVRSLAEANPDEVNQLWAGLGYYRRAQNLLKGAKYIVENYGGEMPQNREALLNIPGIGPYTAGAICSIAFQQREPLVDGNVLRVFSRLFALYHEIGGGKMEKISWKIAEELVDPEFPGDFNQALMELGATICTPTSPKCSECPVNNLCAAFQLVNRSITPNSSKTKEYNLPSVAIVDIENLPIPKAVTDFPFKKEKKKAKELSFFVMVLRIKAPTTDDQNTNSHWQYLMLRRPETGLLANQWEFPSICLSQNISSKQRNKLSIDANIRERDVEILYSDDENCDGRTNDQADSSNVEDVAETWSTLWKQQCMLDIQRETPTSIMMDHPIWMQFIAQLRLQTGYLLDNSTLAHKSIMNELIDGHIKQDLKQDKSTHLLQTEAIHWFEEPITHIFSHERHTMYVMLHDVIPLTHELSSSYSHLSERVQWRTESEIIAAGLTTGAKKVLSIAAGRDKISKENEISKKISISRSLKKRSLPNESKNSDPIPKQKLSSAQRIKSEISLEEEKSAVFVASVNNLARFLHKPQTTEVKQSDKVQIKMEVIDLID